MCPGGLGGPGGLEEAWEETWEEAWEEIWEEAWRLGRRPGRRPRRRPGRRPGGRLLGYCRAHVVQPHFSLMVVWYLRGGGSAVSDPLPPLKQNLQETTGDNAGAFGR